jgi:hypothetical protein
MTRIGSIGLGWATLNRNILSCMEKCVWLSLGWSGHRQLVELERANDDVEEQHTTFLIKKGRGIIWSHS